MGLGVISAHEEKMMALAIATLHGEGLIEIEEAPVDRWARRFRIQRRLPIRPPVDRNRWLISVLLLCHHNLSAFDEMPASSFRPWGGGLSNGSYPHRGTRKRTAANDHEAVFPLCAAYRSFIPTRIFGHHDVSSRTIVFCSLKGASTRGVWEDTLDAAHQIGGNAGTIYVHSDLRLWKTVGGPSGTPV